MTSMTKVSVRAHVCMITCMTRHSGAGEESCATPARAPSTSKKTKSPVVICLLSSDSEDADDDSDGIR